MMSHSPSPPAMARGRSLRSAQQRALALFALCATSASCSVAANLSADEILTEVDGIVRIEGAGSDQRLVYSERAPVSLWYTRIALLGPLQVPLRWVFGRTTEAQLDRPAAHVRELLRELPDELPRDLVVVAKAAVRLGFIGQLDTNAHNRLVAVDGLARIARLLELPLFAGDLTRFGAPAEAARAEAARAAIQAQRPELRPAGLTRADELQPYAGSLLTWTEAPLADGLARLSVLEEATALLIAEPVAEVRAIARDAVRAALRHMIEGLLLEIVQGRGRDTVDLRLCTMEQIRRLGGPRVVPLLLAVMARSPAEQARQEVSYDPDVQLRLIQYCGQLRGELADTVVQLPGRLGYEVASPRDFLAITILNEKDLYSKLRTPALVALTWSLQRPRLDPDPAWVRQWREQRR